MVDQGMDEQARRPLRVAVVQDRSATWSLADQLQSEALQLTSIGTLAGLEETLAAGNVDVVVVDPEFREAWPTKVGQQLDQHAARRCPVIVVCRSADTAALIKRRTNAVLDVLLRDDVSAEDLRELVRGAGLRFRTRMRP
jgi:DNA-binding NtrC family response regulator